MRRRERPSEFGKLGLIPIGVSLALSSEGCQGLDNCEGQPNAPRIKGNHSNKSQWEEMSSYCVHTWSSSERKLPDSGHFRSLLKLQGKAWPVFPQPRERVSLNPGLDFPKGVLKCSCLCFRVCGSGERWGSGTWLNYLALFISIAPLLLMSIGSAS